MSLGASMRIMIAIHGDEQPGWARELACLRPLLILATVRVLVVSDLAMPAFTSLTPWARRAYASALAGWRHQEEAKAQRSLDDLSSAVGVDFEIVRVQSSHGNPGRTIGEHAEEWGANLVVVGVQEPGGLEELLLGTAHEHVMRVAPCSVLVWCRWEAQQRQRRRALLLTESASG